MDYQYPDYDNMGKDDDYYRNVLRENQAFYAKSRLREEEQSKEEFIGLLRKIERFNLSPRGMHHLYLIYEDIYED